MMSREWFCWSIGLAFLTSAAIADDPVFSGPQVGERLPPLTAQSPFGETAGEEIEIVEAADRPIVLIFVHERTRPAFGLTNRIMEYVATRNDTGLHGAVVFLTDDPTSTGKWMNLVQGYFPKGVRFGISVDGVEGPGSYGLNRNVALTVLIAKKGKVTDNFALIQPSLQADGPKIIKSIVKVLGEDEVPTIEELGWTEYMRGDRRTMRQRNSSERGEREPRLAALVRAVIQKDADEKEVKQAAAKVETFVKDNAAARKQLGRMARTAVESGKVESYGTEAAQRFIRLWAEKYGGE